MTFLRPILPFAVAVLCATSALAQQAAGHDDHAHDHEEGHAHQDDHDHAHDHGGHRHGVAEVSVEVAGRMLTTSVTLPGGDLFDGIDEADRNAARAQAILPDPSAIFALPEGLGCELLSSNAQVFEIEAEGDHHGHHDWTLRFMHQCGDLGLLTALDLTLFDHVPALEMADVTVSGPHYRIEAEMTPDRPRLHIRPLAGHDAP